MKASDATTRVLTLRQPDVSVLFLVHIITEVLFGIGAAMKPNLRNFLSFENVRQHLLGGPSQVLSENKNKLAEFGRIIGVCAYQSEMLSRSRVAMLQIMQFVADNDVYTVVIP